MRRRFLAAVAALVLLVAGTAVLLAYVHGADARALAGTRTVDVLVVDQPIPAGTAGSDIAGMVSTEVVPAKVALPGRVTDLAALTGRVATVDLQPGEQLLAARFAAPLRPAGARAPSPCPPGLQEVSVLLEPQRAVGGRLAAGDTVGVVVSLKPDQRRTGLTRSCTTCWSPRSRARRRRSTTEAPTRRRRRRAPPRRRRA